MLSILRMNNFQWKLGTTIMIFNDEFIELQLERADSFSRGDSEYVFFEELFKALRKLENKVDMNARERRDSTGIT